MQKLLIAGVVSGCSVACGQHQFQTLWLTGDEVPGLPGVTIAEVDLSYIESADDYAIRLELAGPGVTPENNQIRGCVAGGVFEALYRLGDPAPGFAGSTLIGLRSFYKADDAHGLWADFHDALGALQTAFWVDDGAGPTLAIQIGAQAPGFGSGVEVTRFFPRRPTPAGVTAGYGDVEGPGVDPNYSSATWFGAAGALELVQAGGDPAPFGGGAFYDLAVNPTIIDDDELVFMALFDGPGITADNNFALVLASGSARTILMRDGEPAPGLPAGTVFANTSSTQFGVTPGSDGALLLRSRVNEPLHPEGTPDGVWLGEAGAFELIMVGGIDAPGLPGVRVDRHWGADYVDGLIAYRGELGGPTIVRENGGAVFAGRSIASIAPVARNGEPFPGEPSAAILIGLNTPRLRPDGAILFGGIVEGPGVTAENNSYDMVVDLNGEPVFSIREGEEVEVRPGDVRTIMNSIGTSWSERGDLILELDFTDGSVGWFAVTVDSVCPADCDGSTGLGVLDIFDFLCFQDAFTTMDPYANCDGNAVFDIFDFLCFQDAFAAGCP